MANMLDEMNDPILEDGRDVNVIAKKIPVEKSTSAVVLALSSSIMTPEKTKSCLTP